MISEAPARDDEDLERLYAQARRYDLLSKAQEQDIDGEKWAAVATIVTLLVEDACSRHYLEHWCVNCSRPLPGIELFDRRQNRSLLRRELADYLPGGCNAPSLNRLAQSIAHQTDHPALLSGLLALSLPGSFVVGMAERVTRTGKGEHGSKIAAALEDWETNWSRAPAPAANIARPANAGSLRAQVKRYEAARDLLIMHNLRLVYSIAGRHRNKGVAFLDLVQEGSLGLLRAAEKFRFERGNRFSTYAFNWITQGVKRHLAESAGTIRLPSHVQEQLGKLHGERGRTLALSGCAPRDTELAGALSLPLDKTRELLQLRTFGASLDAPRFEEDAGSTLLDTTAGGPYHEPSYDAEQGSLNQCLLGEISHLDQPEQDVITLRWGLLDTPPLSRAEIADRMSVSTEWVRLLEQSALRKLGRNETVRAAYRDNYSHPERKKHPTALS